MLKAQISERINHWRIPRWHASPCGNDDPLRLRREAHSIDALSSGLHASVKTVFFLLEGGCEGCPLERGVASRASYDIVDTCRCREVGHTTGGKLFRPWL